MAESAEKEYLTYANYKSSSYGIIQVMRVVEPNSFSNKPPKAKKHKMKWILPIVVAVAAIAVVGWHVVADDSKAVVVVQESVESTQPKIEEVIVVNSNTGEKQLRVFTDNEFTVFYNNLLQSNIVRVENPPSISGNEIADARIRAIAEERGYRLRGSPELGLGAADGFSVQADLSDAWTELKNEAANQGHAIIIVSGYRTVNDQRELFLQRLGAAGASISAVASGDADDLVNQVLVQSSIPGYSKHHTGYTIDIKCEGFAFEEFDISTCNDWLKNDNYRVAKENGFIPSYPPLADAQGPDPEAWEYVYVGTEQLYEFR